MSRDIQSSQVELICKPFGPFKLARAICRALEKEALKPLHSSSSKVSSRRSSHASSPRPRSDQEDTTSMMSRVQSPLHASPKESQSSRTHSSAFFKQDTNSKDVSSGSDGGFPFPNKPVSPMAATDPTIAPVRRRSNSKEPALKRPSYPDHRQTAMDLERDEAASSELSKAPQATRKPSGAPARAATVRVSETAIVDSSSPWTCLLSPRDASRWFSLSMTTNST